jgi:hypothetical protein
MQNNMLQRTDLMQGCRAPLEEFLAKNHAQFWQSGIHHADSMHSFLPPARRHTQTHNLRRAARLPAHLIIKLSARASDGKLEISAGTRSRAPKLEIF